MDIDVLLAKTNYVQNCLQHIRETYNDDPARLHDVNVQDVIVLNLQRAIQGIINIAAHVVSSEGLGISQSLNLLEIPCCNQSSMESLLSESQRSS